MSELLEKHGCEKFLTCLRHHPENPKLAAAGGLFRHPGINSGQSPLDGVAASPPARFSGLHGLADLCARPGDDFDAGALDAFTAGLASPVESGAAPYLDSPGRTDDHRLVIQPGKYRSESLRLSCLPVDRLVFILHIYCE